MSPVPPPPPRLENRLPAEGINSGREHPLREAIWLIGSVLLALILLILMIGWAARWVAPHLPYSVELRLMEHFPDPVQPPAWAAKSAALQALAVPLAKTMALPEGMTLKLRAEPSAQRNAYATLGGRIRVYQGLLQMLESEEALAALLAHEMAHVRERHVTANLGRGMAVALLLSLVSADAGAGAAQQAMGQTAQLGLLGYSREQEREADAAALEALVQHYGHGGGLLDLLALLQQEQAEGLPMLSTHPGTAERLAAVRALAQARGWSLQAPSRPLPAGLRAD